MTVNDIRNKIAGLILPTKNSMSLPNEYLRYGNKTMTPDWTNIVMSDKDLYTGYAYAAIRKRANAVARIAMGNIRTTSGDDEFEHPYLEILKTSPTFTDYSFWHDISTYLDLEGVYYLMAVRAVSENRVGEIQEFKLLNPYNIRRVLSGDQLEVVGYVETRKGFVREIPKGMIIEIRELNPFDEDKPYAMTDAAMESQFTMKTAGDYTRSALRQNINAPGILTTDVILPEQEFTNFIERVRNHRKGEPLFGNGNGAITYQNMQVELSKAALKDVQEMNQQTLMAVSGVSKTILGIEQSGTTRETARVQKELNVESEILPRIQLVLDALNQDYKNSYPKSYETNNAIIVVDNPLAVDHDADLKETELKTKQFELFNSLVNKGYKVEIAAKYVTGELDLEMIGEPTNKPVMTIVGPQEESDEEPEEQNNQIITNQLETDASQITYQQGALKNSIINIERNIVTSALDRVGRAVKNEFDEDWQVITKTEKKENIKELAMVLGAFYGITMLLKGGEVMRDRTGRYAMAGLFMFDKEVKNYIKETSGKVAESHVETVMNDVYRVAREEALKGKSLQEVQSAIRQAFNDDISQTRAETIARTETNRAFTRSQYEADRQFIEQNDLEKQAFKVWRTRSLNPCAFCQELESRGPVPFKMNFESLGSTIKVGDKELKVNFEDLEAGNAHPNCSCIYELIIK